MCLQSSSGGGIKVRSGCTWSVFNYFDRHQELLCSREAESVCFMSSSLKAPVSKPQSIEVL